MQTLTLKVNSCKRRQEDQQSPLPALSTLRLPYRTVVTSVGTRANPASACDTVPSQHIHRRFHCPTTRAKVLLGPGYILCYPHWCLILGSVDFNSWYMVILTLYYKQEKSILTDLVLCMFMGGSKVNLRYYFQVASLAWNSPAELSGQPANPRVPLSLLLQCQNYIGVPPMLASVSLPC